MTTAKSLTYLTGISGLVEWDMQVLDGRLRLTCIVKRDNQTKKYGILVSGISPTTICAYLQIAATSIRECLDGDSEINSESWRKILAGVNEFRRGAGLPDLCLDCRVIDEQVIA